MGGFCSSTSQIGNVSQNTPRENVTPIPNKNDGISSSSFQKASIEDLVKITINGTDYSVKMGLTVYEACELNLRKTHPGRIPPTFCSHPYLPKARNYQGRCGLCEVENANTGELIQSCNAVVSDGLSIVTFGKKIDEHVRSVLLLKLASHPLNCPSCVDNGNCIFQELLHKYELSPADLDGPLRKEYIAACQLSMKGQKICTGNNAVMFNPTKCVDCHRCVRVCEYVQGMSTRTLIKTSERTSTGVRIFRDIEEYHMNMFKDGSDCIMCGQCSFVCPVGAISERPEDLTSVSKILQGKMINSTEDENVVVCQIAPAVRITLCEEFGLKPGSFPVENIVAAIRKMGFDFVFDTQFGADLTILEEANELVERIQKSGPFPMLTSCCPSFVNLVEKQFPEFIPNLSACKSPSQSLGSIIKNYWQ